MVDEIVLEPWESEPDFLSGCYGDVPWFILRVPEMLHLCGYIVVPEQHPWSNRDCMETLDIDVHGGITYERTYFPGAKDGYDSVIRSAPEIERAKEINARFPGGKFIGFDCAHSYDLMPGWKLEGLGGTYRDIEYVQKECEKLAKAAMEATNKQLNW